MQLVPEPMRLANARATITHRRAKETILTADGYVPAHRDAAGRLVPGWRWVYDAAAGCDVPDPRDVEVVSVEESTNVKTTVGIDFLFSQGYNSTAAAQTNGLSWIALSNDALTETGASTTLSSEIAANGLSRAQGTYAHSAGASTATIAKTFTATGSQACQKAALFSASSAGTMNHVLAFTQRTLQNTDTITITYTITIT